MKMFIDNKQLKNGGVLQNIKEIQTCIKPLRKELTSKTSIITDRANLRGAMLPKFLIITCEHKKIQQGVSRKLLTLRLTFFA